MMVVIEFDHTIDEQSIREAFENMAGVISVEIQHCGKCKPEPPRGDGWISVKERLPEKNAEVTIYTPHGGVDTRALGICDDDPNGLWYCYKGVGEPLHFNDVTHWRPLPEPPRGENGENNEI